MRILVVNWQDRLNPQSGGAEIHLHEVFGRLAGWGHEITLLASGFPGSAPREVVDGISVHRVGSRMTFGLSVPGYFRKSWEKDRFDVVVEDLNKVPIFMPVLSPVPVVLLVHHLFGRTAFHEALFPLAAATWLLERAIPLVYRGLDVVAVSQSTAKDLRDRGLEGPEISIVPNGVDLDRFSPDPSAPSSAHPTVLYLGRLKRYKRVDLILKAVAVLKERGGGAPTPRRRQGESGCEAPVSGFEAAVGGNCELSGVCERRGEGQPASEQLGPRSHVTEGGMGNLGTGGGRVRNTHGGQ